MSGGASAPGGPRDWAGDYAALTERDRRSPLSCAELERLAVASFLVGRDDEVVELRERAIEQYLADDEFERAARCAFWLGFHLDNSGRHAMAAGWLAKFERILGRDPATDAALLHLRDLARAGHLLSTGRFAEALPLFENSRERAQQANDLDGLVLSGSGIAACSEALGRLPQAIAAYDEVMVDLLSGPVAPALIGLVYCAMVSTCMRYLDIGRAREWTEALRVWCDEQGGLVPYRGACVLYRAELLQIQGSWAQARVVAAEAIAHPASATIDGLAHYRLAEINRLQGRFDEAEAQFRAAARSGVEVQPGLARLRAAQGQLSAAQSGLERAVTENAPLAVPALQAAQIEIALLRGDLDLAQRALDHLAEVTAAAWASGYLLALAERAAASVSLAQGDPGSATARLRRVAAVLSDLNAPYEAARARLLLADACDALGDHDLATLERDVARDVFAQLGANAELAAIGGPSSRPTGLSPRETQVLRLLATGATNRTIAAELTLSEKTVARHVSNIFGKLGVRSRAAATAWAYRHDLA